ncbi:metal ABC transporter ATP-binding protein [Nocardioides terrisoli]|uniref:metal ABC transporter ATP-binding protein n=1 Tax=Nocardioides terrisoli TaxID=3388267 RepID=UPI00287B8818|nr:ABC transporter ATP-binding protein [Nocardioides marmorisolisilvae]
MNDVITVSDAAVSLSSRPILRHIDLAVQAGEVVALLGANGSGKSTLVKTVVGLHPTTSGEVQLFGVPLRSFTDWQRIGYVPQRSTIAQGVPASVWEVVASGRLARRRPFWPLGRQDREAITTAIAQVGLGDRTHHQVSTLSGGQQQRVLIARTLAGHPGLLVLDEPNAGVDLASQAEIARTLGQRAQDGATILVVLHELGPFAPLVDRTVVMRDGRIEYDGPPRPDLQDHGHHHLPAARTSLGPQVSAPLEER